MATWTVSVMELMAERMAPGMSFENVNDVLTMSEALFSEATLAPISDEYKQRFACGFAWHFLLDEIGLETPALFRVMLAGKIYNNADYINKLMGLADEQAFTHLHRRRGEGMTTHGDTSGSTSTTEDVRDSTTKSATNTQGTQNGTTEMTDDVIQTGNGTTTDTANGTGKVTTDGTTGETTSNTTNGTDDTDGERHFSDTPQNGLQPVRDGTYLTNATVDITHATRGEISGGKRDGTSSRIQDSTQNDTRNGTREDTSKTDGTHKGTQESTSAQNSDTNSTTNATGQAVTKANATQEGYVSRHDTDTDYDIEYDKFFLATPPMDRVWQIFNDLFMMIL